MNETKNNGRVDDEEHALRGGSWFYRSVDCHAAARVRDAPGYRSDVLGLRLVIHTIETPNKVIPTLFD